MSTVMYAYKVKDETLWKVLKNIRTFYEKEYPVYMIATIVAKSTLGGIEYVDKMGKLAEQFSTILQLFRFENYWLFRVLSSDYFFMNHMSDFSDIEPIFYDNRTDIPLECEKNEVFADKMEQMIYNKEYLLYPIVDQESIETYAIEHMFDKE